MSTVYRIPLFSFFLFFCSLFRFDPVWLINSLFVFIFVRFTIRLIFCSSIRYDPVWSIIVLSLSLPVWSGLIILTPCCHHFCPVHYSVEFSALASGMFRYVRLLFQVEQAFLLVGFFSSIPKKYKIWSKKTHGKLKNTRPFY